MSWVSTAKPCSASSVATVAYSEADYLAAAVEPAVESAFLGSFPGVRGVTAEDDAEVRPVGVLVELPHELG